jgi:hypothetical protein
VHNKGKNFLLVSRASPTSIYIAENIQITGEATQDEVDGNMEWEFMQRLSQWRMPTVRFVEARKGSGKWVLPPKEKERTEDEEGIGVDEDG